MKEQEAPTPPKAARSPTEAPCTTVPLSRGDVRYLEVASCVNSIRGGETRSKPKWLSPGLHFLYLTSSCFPH